MENQVLCPFSFIGEKVEENEDMNEMFIAGYRDKVCSDYTHSIFIDEIKETINYQNPTDLQISWMQDVKYFDNVSLSNCIMQYMVDQITDLTVNTLILFMQSAGMPVETIDTFVSDLLGEDRIRDQIVEIVANTELPISREYPEFAQFQLLNIAFSSIYAKIVSTIFENFIDKIMSLITKNGIKDFYVLVFNMVYGTDPVEETSYSNMYNLCIATLREILDQHTMMYRQSLMLVANNIIKMLSGAPRFGQEISNPNYQTDPEEFVRNSGLFISKNAFKSLNGDTEYVNN